jgi:hypothetical protein
MTRLVVMQEFGIEGGTQVTLLIKARFKQCKAREDEIVNSSDNKSVSLLLKIQLINKSKRSKQRTSNIRYF